MAVKYEQPAPGSEPRASSAAVRLRGPTPVSAQMAALGAPSGRRNHLRGERRADRSRRRKRTKTVSLDGLVVVVGVVVLVVALVVGAALVDDRGRPC